MKYGLVSPVPSRMASRERTPSVSSNDSFEIIFSESVRGSISEIPSNTYEPKVIFHEIFDVYPVDSDVISRITWKNDFKKSENDVVMVLPTAWATMEEALCCVKLQGNVVRFDVKDLPKYGEDDKFYQLCYCTESKEVMGVSIPFTFREVHEDELIEFQKEQNKEFWTFRSRFAVLMDNYGRTLTAIGLDTATCEKSEQTMTTCAEKAQQIPEKATKEESRNSFQSTMDEIRVMEEMALLKVQNDNLKEENAVLKQQMQNALIKAENLMTVRDTLIQENERLLLRVEELNQQIANHNERHERELLALKEAEQLFENLKIQTSEKDSQTRENEQKYNSQAWETSQLKLKNTALLQEKEALKLATYFLQNDYKALKEALAEHKERIACLQGEKTLLQEKSSNAEAVFNRIENGLTTCETLLTKKCPNPLVPYKEEVGGEGGGSSGISATAPPPPPPPSPPTTITTTSPGTDSSKGSGGVSTILYGEPFLTSRAAMQYRGLPRFRAETVEAAFEVVSPSPSSCGSPTDDNESVDIWSNLIIAQMRRDTCKVQRVAYNDVVFVICDTDLVRGQLEAQFIWSKCWDFVTVLNPVTKKIVTADPIKFVQTKKKMKRISEWFNGRETSAEVRARTLLVATYHFDDVPNLYHRMKQFCEYMFVVSVSAQTMEKVFGKARKSGGGGEDQSYSFDGSAGGDASAVKATEAPRGTKDEVEKYKKACENWLKTHTDEVDNYKKKCEEWMKNKDLYGQKALDEKTQEINVLNATLMQLSMSLEKYDEQVEMLKAAVAQAENLNTVQQVVEDLTKGNGDVPASRIHTTVSTGGQNEAHVEITNLQTMVTQKSDEINHAEETIMQMSLLLSEYEEEIRSLKIQIQILEKNALARPQNSAKISESKHSLMKEIEELNEELKKERKMNDLVRVDLGNQLRKILELENEIRNCRLNEKALEEQLKCTENTIKEMNTKNAKELEALITAAKEEGKLGLKAKLEAIENEKQTMQAVMYTYDQQMNALTEAVNINKKKETEFATKLVKVTVEKDQLSAQFNLFDSLNGHKVLLEGLQITLEGLKMSLEALNDPSSTIRMKSEYEHRLKEGAKQYAKLYLKYEKRVKRSSSTTEMPAGSSSSTAAAAAAAANGFSP